MVQPEKPILERAFEMARSGDYVRMDEIEQALIGEGYSKNDEHLRGPAIRAQLRQLSIEARRNG